MELVHQVCCNLVVDVFDAESGLDGVDPLFGWGDDSLLLVEVVVELTLKAPDDPGKAGVELGGVGETTADDQGCSGLIDEDGVDLVDQAEHVAALCLLVEGHGHVVTQVVKAKFVVGGIGDVTLVGSCLLDPVARIWHHESHRQAQPAMDLSHPFCIPGGQVVVYGTEVDTPT